MLSSAIGGMSVSFFIATAIRDLREGSRQNASQETCPFTILALNFRDKSLGSPKNTFPYQNLFGMKFRFRAALIGVIISFGINAQNAQDSLAITNLQEVVVADSRFPMQRVQSGKIIMRLGSEELGRYTGMSIADILNRQAGIELSGSRSSPGSVLGVFARGGRGRQVLILIDGIRLLDPSSFGRSYDLRMLPAERVAAIEILKGASSSLYGSNAATLVVRITTKKTVQQELTLDIGSVASSLNTWNQKAVEVGKISSYVSASGGIKDWRFTAAVAQEFADGLSSLKNTEGEQDPNSLWSADLMLGRQWKNGLSLNLFIAQNGLKSDYDNAASGTDADFQFESKQWRTGFRLFNQQANSAWEWHTAYAEFTSWDRGAYPYTYQGERLTSDFIYKYNLRTGLKLLTGLSLEWDATLGKQNFISDPFLNVLFSSATGWNLNTGVRLNAHSAYGTSGVYSINPSRVWETDKGYIKVLSSWSTAYITPTLSQLYGNFGANPDLQPESNFGFEAGTELHLKESSFFASMVLFNRNETNLVIFDGVQSKFFNSDSKIRARGIELEGRGKLSANLNFRTYYTYTRRIGDDAIRIPRHKAGVLFDLKMGKQSNFILDYQYTGSRPDTNFRDFTAVKLNAFSILDLRWQYAFKSNISKIFLLCSNALNANYEEIYGYTTPGRNIGLGWNIRIN